MNLESVTRVAHREFMTIRKEMATKDALKVLQGELKDDLKLLEDNLAKRVIESNDKVATKLDTALKELAAHGHAHKRIDDTVLDHESRLKRVEAVTKH